MKWKHSMSQIICRIGDKIYEISENVLVELLDYPIDEVPFLFPSLCDYYCVSYLVEINNLIRHYIVLGCMYVVLDITPYISALFRAFENT